MVKAIVAGAAGRMGARIINMIHNSEGIILTGAFEHPENRYTGQDAGQTAGLGEIGIRIAGSLDEVIDLGEVVIDFTTPRAPIENIRKVASHGLSMVIGTTGITGEDLKQIEKMAGKIRCVMFPNMRGGGNVMFRIVEGMAGSVGG